MKMTFDVTREWLEKTLKKCDDSNVSAGGTMRVEVDTNVAQNGIYNPLGEVARREVGMTVRAKMSCNMIEQYAGGGVKIRMGAVYSSDPNSENRAFSDATPSGSCEMMIQGGRPAIKLFEPGEFYYVDFTKAPKS